jgi:choice-of-anchor B domain-containing protein
MNLCRALFLLLILPAFQLLAQKNMTLLGRLPFPQGSSALWGYTAPDGGEWVIMGTKTGTSIVDISNPYNPKQKFFIPGTNTTWREAKTYRHYAYVSIDGTANGRPDNGILIVNLQYLPDSINYYYWKGDSNYQFERSHTLVVEEDKGYLYINGHSTPGTKKGTLICDIITNPFVPAIIGMYNEDYVHDCYIRNDTMWTAEIYSGYCAVVDIKDRTNPKLLTKFLTPMREAHNTWLSDDGKTLYTTDEKRFATVGVYNVEDIFDIELINQYQKVPGAAVIPHNVRVLNDFLVIAYYADGVVIADATDPENIITVGNYDTAPGFSGGTFNGCWEVYPFFPSGLIAASDIEKGLHIIEPEYIRGCYLHGEARDYFTDQPIHQVSVHIAVTADTNSTRLASTKSKNDGTIKTGVADAGEFAVWAFKQGYYLNMKPGNTFNNGDTTHIVFYMIADSVDTTALSVNTPNFTPLEVYPSITSSTAKVVLPQNIGQAGNGGVLFNARGQVIKSWNSLPQNTPFTVDLSTYPAGKYWLNIIDHTGTRYIATIMKQ